MKKRTAIVLVTTIAVSLFIGFILGNHKFVNTDTSFKDTQVIKSLTKEKQVVLVNLGVSEVLTAKQSIQLFDTDLFGTNKYKYVQAEFDAKLGLDGKKVTIEKTNDNTYKIKIPEFIFIGHSNEKFSVIAENNDILSWVTPDINETQMVTKILNSTAQQKYLKKYHDLLKESTQDFYGSLLRTVNPEAKLVYEFPKK
ncbi:hypothetical protein ACWOAH_00930 [Vagococcus vulneris]|uniref:DUF4230 domain-containing protein n=1 Tax=Vagococcus vulneris TaxID=1977869 RepID=A0A430A260_9ENTE|nr:hypothetical protein [Vagococcus vulneris]RSU00549.1 hypothetical protein CBF37_00610 [Vagococcus vulneris]